MIKYFIYILLIIPGLALPYGFYRYFYQETKYSPFFSISVKPAGDNKLETQAFIQGQFTTRGEGYFVGKKITITLMLYLQNKVEYNSIKGMVPAIPVINSIVANETIKDLRDSIKDGNPEKAFLNPGLLKLIKAYDDKNILIYEGRVIFKKEGGISFGLPLSALLDKYKLKIEDVNISAEHIKYGIDSNKLAFLLSVVSASIACLSLFLALQNFLKK